MAADPWQAWREWTQHMAASFNIAAPGTPPGLGPAPGGVPPLAPWMASFERFANEARAYLAEIGPASQNSSAAAAEAARRFGDHLREQLERALPLWSAFTAPPAGAAPGAAPLAPALGATRAHQQRTERVLLAAQRAQEAQQRLQRLWSDALREAAMSFSSKLIAEPRPAASAESLRALYDGWVDCAESAYARIAHGPEFCQALADLVNATSAWRQEAQAGVEQWAKMLDLPTRSELNSLNARLTALEAALHSAQAPTPAQTSTQTSTQTPTQTPTQSSAPVKPPKRRPAGKSKR